MKENQPELKPRPSIKAVPRIRFIEVARAYEARALSLILSTRQF